MTEVLTIIGGFVTGRNVLDRVAETAVRMGLADDAETLVFRSAMNARDWHEKVHARLVITHSAGALAMQQDMRPKQWIAYNGPEPRAPLRLAGSAVRKTAQHMYHTAAGPYRQAYARTVASNTAEFALHPYGNLRHLSQISRTSTVGRLAALQQSGVSVGAVRTEGDVFFRHDPAESLPQNMPVHVVPGGHDELLVDPERMLAAMQYFIEE